MESLERIKTLLKPAVFLIRSKIKCARPIRKLLTQNYSTGKIALGEKNRYGIPYSWVTLDIDDADFVLNFRSHRPLPFDDGSQACIYSSHMIEHIDLETLRKLLKDAYRILKPGGGLRLEAPDAKKMVSAYRDLDVEFLDKFAAENKDNLVLKHGYPPVYGERHIAFLGIISCYLSDQKFHVPALATKVEIDEKLKTLELDQFLDWCVSLQSPDQYRSGGHISGLYYEKVAGLLKEAGFSKVRLAQLKDTQIPNLKLSKRLERTHRAFYSFIVEAIK